MDLIREKLASADDMQAALLRNGVYYDQKTIEERAKSKQYPQTPLSFTELSTFNTWFVLHPEKICGQEVITTSKEFPVTIQGDKSKILATIQKQQSYSILEMEALALEYELQINQL
ncbi:hypothetical protein [Flavobacterium sp.]|uniref:hypothetical protein n=1 Tax=Flavobacterium sp. TaxID=239 RepID=UPI0025E2C575|nr:hypothetical protein [Flavobacterium sp.]